MTSNDFGLHNKFVDFLYAMNDREERGVLASLRRGLGKQPGTEPQMYRYVIPFNKMGRRGLLYCRLALCNASNETDWNKHGRNVSQGACPDTKRERRKAICSSLELT